MLAQSACKNERRLRIGKIVHNAFIMSRPNQHISPLPLAQRER